MMTFEQTQQLIDFLNKRHATLVRALIREEGAELRGRIKEIENIVAVLTNPDKPSDD
jgi:phosphopantothenoylcysteine synthetase/decarboxylase